MENFIVSARKYRPATFDTVVGQNSITSTLKNAIKNNILAQAFLFCGPRGIGKTTCARIMAKTINCQNLSENIEACNKCESCTSFNNAASFNIHELDAASNNSVEDIRNLVEQVRIPPQVGKYKVYIIDEVHMLSSNAFNAFLKTLEEPPPYAKFILATTEKHKIIPTILSRCQIFDFKRIGVEDIANHLKFVAQNEHIEAETDALHIIAQKADGALRDALSIFDQLVSFSSANITYKNVIDNLNILDYDYYFKIVDATLKNDITNSLLILNDIFENGFDGQHFIIGLAEHLRNLLVCKDKATLSLLEVGENIKSRYAEQAKQADIMFLIKGLEIINHCDIEYRGSNNKRLRLELSLMQMCSLKSGALHPQSEPIIIPPQKKTENQSTKSIVSEPIPKPLTNEPQAVSQPTIVNEPKTVPVKDPEPKPVQKKTGPRMPGSISIKGNINKVEEEASTYKSTIHTLPDTDFTQEDLETQWSNYLSSEADQTPSFVNALRKYTPILKDNYLVEFKTDNKVIANDRQNINKVQAYLKEHLQNQKLSLQSVITLKEENNTAYTDEEKFDEMKKKNPALQDLKDQLDLEIEF
ncbi:MAG: DNA polymerase III subunit gamma/tau [Bacteroidetes bacterium HGW-Bacteroidetes-17]|nr:MAG: DNA polymerase III subunit gamma/tau [Bacteroidetes bacterium HGW-Bacteroidetes-17]